VAAFGGADCTSIDGTGMEKWLVLCTVADYGAQNCQHSTNLIEEQKLI
jgi:hypothetical protein